MSQKHHYYKPKALIHFLRFSWHWWLLFAVEQTQNELREKGKTCCKGSRVRNRTLDRRAED